MKPETLEDKLRRLISAAGGSYKLFGTSVYVNREGKVKLMCEPAQKGTYDIDFQMLVTGDRADTISVSEKMDYVGREYEPE